jgi:hypothetical protein
MDGFTFPPRFLKMSEVCTTEGLGSQGAVPIINIFLTKVSRHYLSSIASAITLLRYDLKPCFSFLVHLTCDR